MTNNYGLNARICRSADVLAMADHHAACQEAERRSLVDAYYDSVLSVTNKSPVSASVIEKIIDSEGDLRAHVTRFIHAVSSLELPEDFTWIAHPLSFTRTLFIDALG